MHVQTSALPISAARLFEALVQVCEERGTPIETVSETEWMKRLKATAMTPSASDRLQKLNAAAESMIAYLRSPIHFDSTVFHAALKRSQLRTSSSSQSSKQEEVETWKTIDTAYLQRFVRKLL